MIYLLTQMILCLILAGVTGGAVGWLLHRARAGREDEALRETIVRQHHQLRHAETDVAMLTDDFDDLKQRSQAEIETLRRDVRRLPTLLQNLDKSQTLVRQLMQKHEGQLREAAQQNESLRARLAGHDEREAAFARARSELESARAELAVLRVAGRADAPPAPAPPIVAGAASAAVVPAVPARPASGVVAVDASADASAEAPAAVPYDPPPAAPSRNAAPPAGGTGAASGAAHPAAPIGAGIPLDAVRSGFGIDAAAMPFGAPDDDGAPFPDATIVADRSEVAGLDADDEPGGLGLGRGSAVVGGPRLDVGYDDGYDDADADDDGADHEDGDDEDGDHEDDLLDESVELLFEPVDRHDDLQRIFGIGPVTERALNRLGITSYSQLAELQRHEVEQIADALQIYPGRIERDDWVGNARRQLEDVLEEL